MSESEYEFDIEGSEEEEYINKSSRPSLRSVNREM